MTIWPGDDLRLESPAYLCLCDRIEADVGSGRLRPGEQLPPQRDLARLLKVTVGTVGRAYQEARRRGLVRGEVGRGTFVRERPEPPPDRSGPLDLSVNGPNLRLPGGPIRETLERLLDEGELESRLGYWPPAGARHAREAARRWLAPFGLEVEDPDELVLCSGGQHAMLVALAAVARPGDVVLSESPCYTGIRSVAQLLNLRLQAVEMDAEGLSASAFEAACQRERPRALYCTPTFQNPTGALMSAARREEIGEIATAHGVVVVEDDLYGFLAEPPSRPLSRGTRHGVFLSSMSKGLAPGLRYGVIHASRELAARMAGGVMASTLSLPPLLAETATRLLDDGSVDRLLHRQREQLRRRRHEADARLAEFVDPCCHPRSPHLWLQLPSPWRVEHFVAEAEQRGVRVAPASRFVLGRAQAPHAVRVSLGGTPEDAALHAGLDVLAELLKEPPPPSFSGP